MTTASTRSCLIFNFINNSGRRDIYPAGFDVENWHIMDARARSASLPARPSAFYLMEEGTVDTFGNTDDQQDYDITGTGLHHTTSGGTRAVKRTRRFFRACQRARRRHHHLHARHAEPDHTGDTVTIDEDATEDGRPVYAGLPGSGAQLRFTATAGAEIRAIECEFAGERGRGDLNQT